MNTVLASASPRRRELLTNLGIAFSVMPSDRESAPVPGETPAETVARIALGKARDVSSRCPADTLVIAADTLVYLDGEPLGKPSDRNEAASMLRRLSGRTHSVLTGVALILDGRELSRAEETAVSFRCLSDGEIDWYIGTGEPMDKAGAYGIQGLGSVLIDGINGDYFNVMGLPLCRLESMLREFGLSVTTLRGYTSI